jgi:hypothetical protein
VEHVHTTFFFAQDVVGCSYVEDQHTVFPREVGDRQQLPSRNVGKDVAVTLFDHVLERRHDIRIRPHLGDVEGEFLIEEPAGRVVVADRHFSAGDALVARRYIEDRQRQPWIVGAQIAKPDLGELYFGRCLPLGGLRLWSSLLCQRDPNADTCQK